MGELSRHKERNIAVFFGDETFPKFGRGRHNKKFATCIAKLAKVLKELEIERVFLPSYKGTNMAAALVMHQLDVPYTLVIPHPSFGSMSTIHDKLELATASKNAAKTIVFSADDSSGLMFPVEEVTTDFVEYISRHCNSVIIAHSNDPTDKFLKLLSHFKEDAFKKTFSFIY